jgi:hypothetical protein
MGGARNQDSDRGNVHASAVTELAAREAVERIVQEVHPTRIIKQPKARSSEESGDGVA